MMKIVVKETGLVVASHAKEAKSITQRMLGLMFSKSIPNGDALWIRPCNSIHTFFMNYPIDVLFIDKNLRVIKIYENLKPWRITPIHFRCASVLELSGGVLDGKVHVDEQLEVLDV